MQSFRAAIEIYLSLLRGVRRRALWIPILSAISGVLESSSIVILFSTNFISASPETGKVARLVLDMGITPLAGVVIFLLVYGGAAGLQYAVRLLEGTVMTHVELEKRAGLMLDVIRAEWVYLSAVPIEKIHTALTSCIYALRVGLKAFLELASDTLVLAAFVVVATITAPLPVFSACLAGMVYLGFYLQITRKIRANAAETPRANGTLFREYGNVLHNLKLWKVSADNERINANLRPALNKIKEIELVAKHLSARNRFGFLMFGGLFIAALTLTAIYTNGTATGSVFAIIVLFLRISSKVFNIQAAILGLVHQYHSIKMLHDLQLDMRARGERVTGKVKAQLQRQMTFERISFSYESNNRSVFKDLSFVLERGQFIGILGRSGIGKSTLLDMICGLLKPSSGRISVDGADFSDLDLSHWRRSIGFLTQEAPLVTGTVRDNILWGQPYDADRFQSALRDANLEEWVHSLTGGIDAKVKSGGIQFSGGQRQRLALARALYKGASLLLLDEPTSSVDRESEVQIVKAIEKLKGNTTIVLITHDQEILKSADVVYTVVNGGLTRVTEELSSGVA
ncbi:MAG: ATP-binding cassette domain-containing protein [Bdellovibrionales bacterium]|nr:ATP-binding cassette domain-containing protein [Bdellovibrionales bacterium]